MLFSNVMKLPVITKNNKNIKKIEIVPDNVKYNINKIKKIKKELDNFMYIIDEKCYISYNNQTDDIMFTYGNDIFDKHGIFSLESVLTINNKQTSNNPFAEILRDDLNGYYKNAYNSLQNALLKYGQLVDELKRAQDELNLYLKEKNKKKLISEYKTYSNYYENFKWTTKELQDYFRDKKNEMLEKYNDIDNYFKQEELKKTEIKLPNINLSNNRNVNKIEKNNYYNPNYANQLKNPYSINNNPYSINNNHLENPFKLEINKNKLNNVKLPTINNYGNNLNQQFQMNKEINHNANQGMNIFNNNQKYYKFNNNINNNNNQNKYNDYKNIQHEYKQEQNNGNNINNNIKLPNINKNITSNNKKIKKLKEIKLTEQQKIFKGQKKILANLNKQLNPILKKNNLSDSIKQVIKQTQEVIDTQQKQLDIEQKEVKKELSELKNEQNKKNKFFSKQANEYLNKEVEQEYNKIEKDLEQNKSNKKPINKENINEDDAEKKLGEFLKI